MLDGVYERVHADVEVGQEHGGVVATRDRARVAFAVTAITEIEIESESGCRLIGVVY